MHRRAIRRLALLLCGSTPIFGHLITSPASLPHITATAYPNVGVGQDELLGRLPGHQLFKRASIPCDGNSFWCPAGTCFVDLKTPYSGLIGCCSVASCAPRTQCIPYTSSVTSPCDINTGGCLYCSDPEAPACLTMTHVGDHQWIQYCAAYPSTETVDYSTGGSYAMSVWDGDDGVSTTDTLTQASFSPVPGMQVRPSSVASSSQVESTTIAAVVTGATTTSASEDTLSESATATSASTNILTAVALSTSTPQQTKTGGVSGGLIAGVAVGAFAVCGLLVAALWFTRSFLLSCCLPSRKSSSGSIGTEKQGSGSASSPSGTSKASGQTSAEGPTPRMPSAFHSPDHVPMHAELEGRFGSVSAPWPVDTVGVRGLGIAGINQRRYAPTNPDPMSAVDEEHSPTDVGPPTRPGTSEMPGDRPLPASPAVSSVPSPNTADLSSSPGGIGAVSPITTHTQAPYTPSAYGYEPPSSVPRTVAAAPPSMPQDYSLVTLGSSANIYRGLSRHETAPWAYLSPEEAVRGGWRNGDAE